MSMAKKRMDDVIQYDRGHTPCREVATVYWELYEIAEQFQTFDMEVVEE